MRVVVGRTFTVLLEARQARYECRKCKMMISSFSRDGVASFARSSLGRRVVTRTHRGSRSLSKYTNPPGPTPPLFAVSASNLLLDPSQWVYPHLNQLQQLPEVSQALSSAIPSKDILDGLGRAVDIFSNVQEDLHRACLVLLAACQQRSGDYKEAHKTLLKLQQQSTGNVIEDIQLSLARSKVLWLSGDCIPAKALCDDILKQPDLPFPLLISARTGQAVNRLLLVTCIDDVFSVRDPFRMAVKAIESARGAASPNMLAMAHLNMGVAEAAYVQVISNERGETVPYDAAMRAWKQGLTILKRAAGGGSDPWKRALQARLHTNMAWGLLQMKSEPNHVERASEFARDALKVYDEQPTNNDEEALYKEGLGRTLTLAATCYHQASNAVTAEGLLQSAIDEIYALSSSSPLDQVALREAYRAYAALCRDWDKRNRDAEKMNDQAEAVQDSLPIIWQTKSDVYSSLWF